MEKIIILFIVTSHSVVGDTGNPTGVWFEELSTPYYKFIDAGYEVEVVSISGGDIPIDPRSQEEAGKNPESVERFLADNIAMSKIKATPSIDNIDTRKYSAIFLPGGHGTMWDYPENKNLANIVSKTLSDNKIVAAVCHGPAGLVSAKDANGDSIVKGKTVAAFTNSEEEAVEHTDVVPFLLETRLKELGANFSSVEDFQPHAVADGNLITGQNPASSEKVAELVIATLNKK